MHIDFDSFFRNRIEGMLIRASWVGALRALLGMKGVSQIWNGNAAWYLWLDRAPGAYLLAFSEGDVVDTTDHRLFEGRFALKCYPYPDHPGFGGFSLEERRLVQSDLFDTSHTPRFEAAAQISDTLFTVGGISLLCAAEDAPALLTYQSLDALRVIQREQTSAAAKADKSGKVARLVRNVAGWTMGYPLFDCLVGLYVHLTRRPPAFIGATRSRGFEYLRFADGKAACRPSRETTQTTLTVGFHSSNVDAAGIETLWQNLLEPGEEIQIARQLPASIENDLGEDLPDHISLNPLWWEIATGDFKSELTSTCGCGDTHCHHTHNIGSHEH